MSNSKKRSALFAPLMITALLIVSMITTIAYAYFYAERNANTTIGFHGGVTLTIQAKDYPTSSSSGITLTSTNNGEWLRKVDNETTWGTSNNAQFKLTMSGLRVSPEDSTGGVFVRVMVVVVVDYEGDTAPTIPSVPFASGATPITPSSANCTTKEWERLTTLGTEPNQAIQSGIAIVSLPTTQDTFTTILNDYNILVPNTTTITNEWQNASISAMIMITASTENNMDAWNQASEQASYTFTLD